MPRHGVLALVAAAVLSLAGCNTLDGDYYPACTAFEGDHIKLTGSTFVWDRYTDQVRLGPDRQPIDPFPDYPRDGTIAATGDTLQLRFADDDSTRSLYVVAHQDRTWLLTDSQKTSFDESGDVDACALVREGA